MNRTIKMDVQFVRSLMGRIVDYEPVAGANHPQSVRASQVLLGEDFGGAAMGQHHSGQEYHPVGGHCLTQVVSRLDHRLAQTHIFGKAGFDRSRRAEIDSDQWLVEQEQIVILGQALGHQHSLPLTSRKFVK